MIRLTKLLWLALALPAAACARSAESHFFDSDGVRIRYIDEGAGEPVLLIHGFSVQLDANWVGPGIVGALVDAGYRVIAYDNRGHGASDKPHDPPAYGVPEIEDAVRLLDHLGMESAHVVGYSRGGAIAMGVWALHPERVRTLVLGGSPGQRLPPSAAAAEIIDSVAAGNAGPMMRALAPADGAPPPPGTDSIAAALRQIWAANDFAALAAALRAGPFPAVAPHRLQTNTTPTLAIVGERDRAKPAVDALVARMAAAEEVVIAGASHTSAPADPEFVRTLLDFLAEHASHE